MRGALFVFASLSVGGLVGCPSKDEAAPATCTGTQALTEASVFGTSIATPKTIALSFDDGPASRTGELSTYLKQQAIRATFFVNNNAQQTAHIGVLAQLAADGHVIGNHTKSHPDLVGGGLTPQQMIDELADVDTLIAPYVPNNRFLFRAPFGSWNKDVYDALKTSAMNKYVGHVEWESGGYLQAPNNAADVACFQDQSMTSKACGDLYIADIADKGTKGIVLMHDADYGDSANTNIDAGKGNTVDMVKYIVPLLKADGYTFIGVDEVPDIAAVLPPLPPKDAGAEGGEGGASSSGATSSSGGGSSSGATSSSGGSSSGSNPCP
jgi:peptidoglycan/xylan/chitin deacetylase (PgdA/CDA1 family)